MIVRAAAATGRRRSPMPPPVVPPDVPRAAPAVRAAYARAILACAGVQDAALERAFATVPRECHVGPPPWRLLHGGAPTSDPDRLYHDVLVVLDADRGINNGQPSLHAACLARAAPAPGDRVLQVGAGTGYYTAILAELVGPAGAVTAWEIAPGLAGWARAALAGRANVEVRTASALDGPLPPGDVLYASAGVSDLPRCWLDALRPGGRLVAPLTDACGRGAMLQLQRLDGDRWSAALFERVSFIGCIGGHDPASEAALADALRDRSPNAVRSYVRGRAPDRSAWFVGRDGWLSTAAP